MKPEQIASSQFEVVQGKPIEDVLRRAVRRALLEHKRAGNTIAAWENGRVVLIPATDISIEETDDEPDESPANS